ncbi:Asp-tRNA(Asn)/Glu-tRNA(Gln) amidotransferase subunit GatC [Candidatus Babeliales bacterium]|nr:Asp-tRNA(Asn)/Glu-tRNA(Gln) amidotransferase subunit GatC [Candidatus Babeliales bacterium]
MSDINRQELEKIAKLSGLTLTEKEATEFAIQLKKVLDYTEEITNLSLGTEVEATRSVNVFREDKAKKQDANPILEIAPKTKDTFFVVPKVLD